MKELEDLAETIKAQLNLEYDAMSVKYMEGFIERQREVFDKDDRNGIINAIGSFVGQCVIKNYGGYWLVDPETQTLCVAFDAQNRVFPFAKTAKQFENGLVDSIYSFYSIIPTVFQINTAPMIDDNNSATSIDTSNNVKKWWKFW